MFGVLLLLAGFTYPPSPILSVEIEHAAELPQVVDIDSLIQQKALQYSVNESHLRATIKCESGFKISALGDHGLARGLAQIRSDYHSEVSDAEAYSPEFSVDFMAKAFSEGREKEWSCWRSQFGG